jgi:CHC2 zinc finger/Toprim-like
MNDGFERITEYERNLPERIRTYLRDVRGISDETVRHHLLGWDGHRITIPVFNRDGLFSFFKLAKDPEDTSDSPKMLAPQGTRAELYGWERIRMKPERIVICEGEFDRLVLESRGMAAVTSTGGAQVFRREWAEDFKDIPQMYVAFDNDAAGRAGAERVAQLIPHARVLSWPEEIGDGGDVTDFFVRLGKTPEDFFSLLDAAQPVPPAPPQTRTSAAVRVGKQDNGEIAALKSRICIEDVIGRSVPLRPSGATFAGRCPFHEDRRPSFVVYPVTQSFHCFGCQAHGDVITFLMRKEGLTFPQAVEALKQLAS